jgi:hypothetical protein
MTKAQEEGLYRLGQLSLLVSNRLEFLSSTVSPRVTFEVMREPSTLALNKGEKDLLAGLEQEMVLTVCAGSYTIAEVNSFFKYCMSLVTVGYQQLGNLLTGLVFKSLNTLSLY